MEYLSLLPTKQHQRWHNWDLGSLLSKLLNMQLIFFTFAIDNYTNNTYNMCCDSSMNLAFLPVHKDQLASCLVV